MEIVPGGFANAIAFKYNKSTIPSSGTRLGRYMKNIRKTRYYNMIPISCRVLALVLVIFWPHCLPAYAVPPPQAKTLKSASELDYPPFAIVQADGTASGFSVELLKAAVEASGYSVSFKTGPWHELKQELVEKKIDVLPLVSYSAERDKVYDFTAPYLRMSGAIFVRKEDSSIKNLNDLMDKEVLVMQGDTAHEYVVREKLTNKVIPTVSYEEAFKLLSSGTHDAVVVQQIVGLQMIKKMRITNVRMVEEKTIASLKPAALSLQGFEQKFCFAVPEGDQQLLSLLNEGLAVVYLNGTYNALYEKWFAPILPKPEIPLREIIKQAVFLAIPLLLCLSLLGVWYLRRLVTRKTTKLYGEIEHRKEIEHQLAQTNEKYVKAQEIGKVGSWEYDLQTEKITASIEAKRIYGFDRDTVFFSLAEIESCMPQKARNHKVWQNLVERGIPSEMEFDIITKNTGERRTVISKAELERDGDGKSQRVLGVLQDITERRQADEKLKIAQEELERLFKLVPDLVCIASTSGYLMKINKAWKVTLGFTEEELMSEPLENFIHPDDIEPTRREVARQIGGKSTINFINRYRTQEGSYKWLEWNATPMAGRSLLYAVARDITERKQAEDERRKLQDQLQQAQKMEAIGTLAGGIAHDFNNILGAIIGYAEMAQEDCPPGSMAGDDIRQVLTASNRAKDLVQQILAFSRQAEVEKIPLRPALIIGESIKMLRSSLPTSIEIQQDIDAEAGPIVADPTQVHQIVMNLCTNAFHAMEGTGGVLHISLKTETVSDEQMVNDSHAQQGRYVRLSIRDTGPGISPEIRDKIFDPYFTTKEVGKGTGLGLAMVHGIAKNYGGWVSCDSQMGSGAIFNVYLPIDSSVTLAEDVAVNEIVRGTERILFIDDEEMLADMGKVMLSRLGYQVTVETDSIKALAIFRDQPAAFDLVITDQTMPSLQGSDLARSMLQIRPDLPIILCTGFSTQITEERAKAIGIRGFAHKPMARQNIAALIRKVLTS